MAYYTRPCGAGPGYYTPNTAAVQPTPPRVPFGKNTRFMSLTHRYISKEHNQANLCTGSPGTKKICRFIFGEVCVERYECDCRIAVIHFVIFVFHFISLCRSKICSQTMSY